MVLWRCDNRPIKSLPKDSGGLGGRFIVQNFGIIGYFRFFFSTSFFNYYGVLCRCDNRPIKSLPKDSGGLRGRFTVENFGIIGYFRFFFSTLFFNSVNI